MQLKKKSIGPSLATAACGLLGSLAAQPVAAQAAHDWTADTALFYYGEDQGRVKDASARALIGYNFDEDRKLAVGITVDALTGASPTGAVPTDAVQTFTRPSGNGGYRINAGATPLDDTFRDTRVALSGTYTLPVATASRLLVGLDGSNEYDYFHLGANTRWETDFNQKNTTLFAGLAFGNDRIKPVGGVPTEYASMTRAGAAPNRRTDSDTKTIVDALLGVTQILSRRTLIEAVYGYSTSNGYLNDPYKILSVVDPVTGRPVSNPSDPSMGLYRYEKRPDSRTKQSLFTEFRYALDRDSIAVNYRFMTDDWGVHSHTLETRYRWNMGPSTYLEPQLRYYTQTAGDFYRTLLVNGAPLPAYASADYRLSKMSSWTAGAKYGWKSSSGREYSVRLEYYRQTNDPSAGSGIGVLRNYGELVPSMSAVILQVGAKFGF